MSIWYIELRDMDTCRKVGASRAYFAEERADKARLEMELENPGCYTVKCWLDLDEEETSKAMTTDQPEEQEALIL